MESRELQRGTTLCNGQYTIEKKIGDGGFSITYKAVQNGLNRTVCIKEFFPSGKCVRSTQAKTVHVQGTSEEDFEKYRLKFVEEAQTLARLRHPNIVEVISVFDENNTSYMAMPFIEGQTLQALVKQKGKLDYEQTVNYLGQIAEAVGYIHALPKHILHRDIKPENIIITPDYHAILIDFGSAREFEQDKTQRQTAIITEGYAPLEQYSAVSKKGSYTDIYALGAVYYFTLTGKEPMDAVSRNDKDLPPMLEPKALNPTITDDVNRTILKAMAMKPENRHQTVDEFLDDLYGRKPSKPIPDDDVVIIEKSHKGLWAALAAVVIIAGIIIGLELNNNAQKQKQIDQSVEIRTKAKEVRELITPLENIYWDTTVSLNYHLFHNCSNLTGSNIMEGSIRQAFDSDKKYLCQECVNKVAEYNDHQKNAGEFYNAAVELQNEEYFKEALNYCNKALGMRPDNKEMKKIKQEIESRR